MSTIDNPQPIIPATSMPPQTLGYGLPGPRAQEPEGGITAGDIWRVIKQRKLLIVVTFILLFAVVVAGTFLVRRYAPAYQCEAYIRLVPPAQGWGQVQDQVLPKDYIAYQLATEAAKIKNPTLLQAVLADPQIKNTAFYKYYQDDFDKCLADFDKLLMAAPLRETYLIRVAIAVQDPAEALLIVNKVCSEHVKRSKTSITEESLGRLEHLKGARAEADSELQQVRARISSLRSERDMPAIESEQRVLSEVIAVLTNTKSEMLARVADIEAQLSSARGSDPRNLPLSTEMRLMVEADPVLRFYRQQVEQLDIQTAVALKHLMGENHPQMRVLKSQRDEYFHMETARREELIDDFRGRQVESLNQEIARLRNMLAEIQEQLSAKENAQRDLDSAAQDFQNLTTDQERLGRQLEQLAQAVREAQNVVDVRKSEGQLKHLPATRAPSTPSRPNLLVFLGGGFVFSMLFGVGLAFLREFSDKAVRTPIDIARHGRMSVLGCVPLLDDEEADVDEIEEATRKAPHSLVAESFRQIRTHLTFSGPLESQRVLLFTSPRPEDGKTAVAINLAVTFAQGNQRVLLVDCNFRCPGIREAFPRASRAGLSSVLVGQISLDKAVNTTELSNLDVLTSGPLPPNPAELLGSRQMSELIELAKKSYDRIIFDGPPCLLVSDALVLATQVDAVVMIVRAANSTKGALKRSREQMGRVNARVIGAVLNGVQARPGGYFREQYREFYDYMDDEVVAQELPAGPPDVRADADSDEEPDKS